MRSLLDLRVAALAAFGLTALASACGDGGDQQETQAGLSCTVSYENFAGPLLLDWCVGCHSSALPETERQGAPVGVDFDTLDGIRRHAERIRVRVVELETMPPLGGPTAEERQLLADWIECGMPADGDGFTPPPPSGLDNPEPPPTGACAEPRQPLPADALPRCKAETKDCIVACGNEGDAEACRNACLAADDTPPVDVEGLTVNCAACSLLELLACADRSACHAETAEFLCCVEDCGGGNACSAGPCAGQLQAFGLCVYYNAPECLDYVDGAPSACFAAPESALGLESQR